MILVSVLWILAILSLLALSLGRTSSMELSLAQYGIARAKAYAAARAGLSYAVNLLEKRPSQKNTLLACGVDIGANKKPEDYFKNIKVAEDTHFEISFTSKDHEGGLTSVKYYGLIDEARKINLNAINSDNFRVLSFLMQNTGVESSLADSIAASAVDWHDEDDTAFDREGIHGAENEYYNRLPVPYKTKNRAFDALEELLLVKGMTAAIYAKVKDYLTVFPQTPTEGLQVNLNTAPEFVVRALLMEAARRQQGMEAQAQDLKQAVQAANGVEKSQYYRIHSMGVEEISRVKVTVEAVVSYDDVKTKWVIQSWCRQ